MKKLQPYLDVLFITGDFVAHFTNNDREEPYDPQKYATLMQVHTNLSTMIQKHMSDVMVIPTFGNNDFDLDDEVKAKELFDKVDTSNNNKISVEGKICYKIYFQNYFLLIFNFKNCFKA